MRRLAALLLALFAAGCGGDGMLGPGAPVGGPSAPTLTELQDTIFTPRCAFAGCHVGGGGQAGLDLSAGASFANLVGVASLEQPAFRRVEPFDSADSYLFMKVTGDPRISFAQMPLTGGPLDPSETDAIARWIDAGAEDN